MAITLPIDLPELILLYVVLKIWGALGGWPEAYYRIRRIPYFQIYRIEPDLRVTKRIYPMKEIFQDANPPRFEDKNNGGQYFTGGAIATVRNHAHAPAWMHTWDDARPLNLLKIDEPRIPPDLIAKGYKNNAIVQMKRWNEPRPVGRTAAIGLVLFLLIMGVVLSVWFSYFTGCAVHSPACFGPIGR